MKRQSIVLATISVLAVVNCWAKTTYTVTDLGVLPGDFSNCSYAYSINESGQVVGYSHFGGNHRAALFDSSGSGNNIYLGALAEGDPGYDSCAYSISNSGQIVGEADAGASIGDYPTLFDPTGGCDNINLGSLGSQPGDADDHGIAYSINDNSQIVGWARTKDGKYHAALFDPSGSGTNVDLRTLAGHDMSWAYSINNMGQAVGRSRDTTQQGGRAVLFDLTGSGNNIDLGTLGGPYSWARSINDAGEIVGGANTASGDGHATLFDPTGNASNIDLGTLGGNGSAAYSINDNRQIVGYALTDLGTWYATLFDSTGGGNNVNLNNCIDPAMGWTLTRAYSINNKGWIVGYGLNSEGYEHAFLLKPIPLPGALILGSIGIGLAGWLHRRRTL